MTKAPDLIRAKNLWYGLGRGLHADESLQTLVEVVERMVLRDRLSTLLWHLFEEPLDDLARFVARADSWLSVQEPGRHSAREACYLVCPTSLGPRLLRYFLNWFARRNSGE